MSEIHVYFDASVPGSGEPGFRALARAGNVPAGAGVVIEPVAGSALVRGAFGLIGIRSSTQAEWAACVLALELTARHYELLSRGVVHVHGDADSVLEALETRRAGRRTDERWLARALDLLSGFDAWRPVWITRNANHEADALAHQGTQPGRRMGLAEPLKAA